MSKQNYIHELKCAVVHMAYNNTESRLEIKKIIKNIKKEYGKSNNCSAYILDKLVTKMIHKNVEYANIVFNYIVGEVI